MIHSTIMITASKALKEFIDMQTSMDSLSENWGVSRQTIYNIHDGSSISGEVIAKIMKHTGWEFEAAFNIEEEAK